MITITTLAESEIPAAIRLLEETWVHTYSGLLPTEAIEKAVTVWHSPRLFNKQISNPDVRFLVAKDEGRIVGLSTIIRGSDRGIVIARFYVHPSSQGHGVGKSLYRESLAAFPDGVRARIEVDEHNRRGLSFFEKNGFAPTGSRQEDIEGTRIGLLILEKAL